MRGMCTMTETFNCDVCGEDKPVSEKHSGYPYGLETMWCDACGGSELVADKTEKANLRKVFEDSLTEQQLSLYKWILPSLHVEFIASDPTHRHVYRVDKHVNAKGSEECVSLGGACVLR